MSEGRKEARRLYPAPEGYERHHVDGDTNNNEPENVKIVTRRQHMVDDGRMDALIKRNKEERMIGSRNAMWKGEEANDRSKASRETRRRRREGEIILPGFTDRKHSEETRKKMSETRKRYWERKKAVRIE